MALPLIWSQVVTNRVGPSGAGAAQPFLETPNLPPGLYQATAEVYASWDDPSIQPAGGVYVAQLSVESGENPSPVLGSGDAGTPGQQRFRWASRGTPNSAHAVAVVPLRLLVWQQDQRIRLTIVRTETNYQCSLSLHVERLEAFVLVPQRERERENRASFFEELWRNFR